MTDYGRATDDAINGAIALQQGWRYDKEYDRWRNSGNGMSYQWIPDYLHDPVLCFGLPLPRNTLLFFHEGLGDVLLFNSNHEFFSAENTELRARCLVYLACNKQKSDDAS